MRPDIVNVTEQAVISLKELESRIGVLKNDLAWLAQGLGHTEAARVAAAPVQAGFGLGVSPFALASTPLLASSGPTAFIPAASLVPQAFQNAAWQQAALQAAAGFAPGFALPAQAFQAQQAQALGAALLGTPAAYATPLNPYAFGASAYPGAAGGYAFQATGQPILATTLTPSAFSSIPVASR